jgi:transcriptional regulator PpsR
VATILRRFASPRASFADLDAETAATLVAAASDVALVVDREGVIRDFALGSQDLPEDECGTWIGRQWIQTVTVESRPKVQALLRDAAAGVPPRWRHVNHPSSRGADLPILYHAIRVGPSGRVVAVGRNLVAISALQQRLVEAQQAMERDYSRLRHLEMRYRLLFQMTSEAILIIDASTQKVVECNPTAVELLGRSGKRTKQLTGRPFPEGFDAPSTQAIEALLAAVRGAGRTSATHVRLARGERELLLSASLLRQDGATLYLVRLSSLQSTGAALPATQSTSLKVVEQGPDGFVLTGPNGQVLGANAAFLEMAGLVSEEQARGESLERWLGRPGADLNVLIANLRQHGSVRLFATTLQGEYGSVSEVEISAVAVYDGEAPCLGFIIRHVGRRLATHARGGRELPRSVEQLTELVGRVSLKDLVRETTDVIERLCIEAALELTADNRASAAEMLGVSRQALYSKLRRYGLGDLEPERAFKPSE